MPKKVSKKNTSASRAATRKIASRKTASRKTASRKTASRTSQKSSLADMAFEAIKEKILKLYFLHGQYLNEGALCALLKVGRSA